MPTDTTASARMMAARMKALQAGTASLPDVVCAIMSSNLAGNLRRSAAAGPFGPAGFSASLRRVVLAWPEMSLAVMVVGFAMFAVLDGAICLLGCSPARGRGAARLTRSPVSPRARSRSAAGPLPSVAAVRARDLGGRDGSPGLRAAIDFGDRVTVRWVAAILALLASSPGHRPHRPR